MKKLDLLIKEKERKEKYILTEVKFASKIFYQEKRKRADSEPLKKKFHKINFGDDLQNREKNENHSENEIWQMKKNLEMQREVILKLSDKLCAQEIVVNSQKSKLVKLQGVDSNLYF